MTLPLSLARHPERPDTLAFAGVIAMSLRAGRAPLIRGLSEDGFSHLIDEYFPGLDCRNGASPVAGGRGRLFELDEFDDLVELLLDHRAGGRVQETWLAHAIATAAMGENHLWQDMGLPSRRVLSELMTTHFPALAAKNVGDMKWKKFFYRQLCERSGIPICKSPHCADCCDFRICFGPEDN
ncbi:nitrogen fixation protein NifQ [Propionivibrio dicarboxylicus]|uniref:Nitrogen fixation protein NifQ n=1 Tax=Propionivibrio dicarboxylicus TaxID=83767 RepID=A0A1G7VD22_9RHOO|nr:nitrogen fixation protein NifQ [Propionivibrio dicarboxylicus]SDG57249.1 nitrogen fixation protein NifQ [Propionivibrio dicarboxylicus]